MPQSVLHVATPFGDIVHMEKGSRPARYSFIAYF
jgi:hypothetical protein